MVNHLKGSDLLRDAAYRVQGNWHNNSSYSHPIFTARYNIVAWLKEHDPSSRAFVSFCRVDEALVAMDGVIHAKGLVSKFQHIMPLIPKPELEHMGVIKGIDALQALLRSPQTDPRAHTQPSRSHIYIPELPDHYVYTHDDGSAVAVVFDYHLPSVEPTFPKAITKVSARLLTASVIEDLPRTQFLHSNERLTPPDYMLGLSTSPTEFGRRLIAESTAEHLLSIA